MDQAHCEECRETYTEEECPRCAAKEREAADESKKLWIQVSSHPVELTNEAGVCFVNVWFVQRCFGGREEGGWWYDCGEILRVIVLPDRVQAEALKQSLETGDFANTGRRPLSSVLSEGEFRVTIDPEPGADWPREKPRYQ